MKMKLHETMVQKLIKVYEVNSGWTEEKKLIAALRNLDLSIYTQANGNQVLVPTEQLQAALSQNENADERQDRINKMVEQAKRINRG